MSEQAFKNLISGKTRGITAEVARSLLHLLSIPYGLLISVRNLAFDRQWKKQTAVGVPVIAIGNVTTGGTGKTPVVAAVVRMLQKSGRRPGIVSRGYGADESGENDEKRVLAQQCPGVPHEQNPDRISAAKTLIAEQDVDVIVLDDAFQHRRIVRDLNIVLIDATNPFGYEHLLPRGLLRESLSSLKRADLVLITRSNNVEESALRAIESRILEHNTELSERVFRVTFEPTRLMSQTGEHPISKANETPVTVLTAIGNPDAFMETCRQVGANIKGSVFFPDHHIYTAAELANVQQQATEAKAPLILTTLKDFVKIPDGHDNIMAVEIETVFGSDPAERYVCNEVCRAGQRP